MSSTSVINEDEVAQLLTGRNYVSWSQLDTMRRCPRLYAYRYIENAEPAFVSSSLVLGSSLHAAIEHHLRALFEGYRAHPADLVEALRQRFQVGDDRRPDLPVRWNKTETAESALAQAERMLDAFLDNEASTPAGELLAVEEQLRGEGPPWLGRGVDGEAHRQRAGGTQMPFLKKPSPAGEWGGEADGKMQVGAADETCGAELA